MKHVLFFIESLAGGGAEKVLSTLVKHIDKKRFDVTVCAICGGGKYEKDVADSVKYISILKEPSSYSCIGKLWYALKYKLIHYWLPMRVVYRLFVPKGYDVKVAFVEGFATKLLAASSDKKAKKVAWVHCDLKNQPWPIEQGIYKNLEEEQETYRKYNSVVCVSKVVEQVMLDYYGLSNTTTIYNPVDSAAIRLFAQSMPTLVVNNNVFNIVSVGRLEKVKGYDLLIPIIKQLVDEGRKVHLYLIGEGSEKSSLQSQVTELGVVNHVTFTGFLKNPYALMSKMNLFVCSSRAEGFSLVIAESLILGVPVISMNCSGPKELLGNNEYGFLCDTYEQLNEEVKAVIEGLKIPCTIPPLVNLNNTIEQIHRILD